MEKTHIYPPNPICHMGYPKHFIELLQLRFQITILLLLNVLNPKSYCSTTFVSCGNDEIRIDHKKILYLFKCFKEVKKWVYDLLSYRNRIRHFYFFITHRLSWTVSCNVDIPLILGRWMVPDGFLHSLSHAFF